MTSTDPTSAPAFGKLVGGVPAAVLGALSALRGRRIFHPVGAAYAGRIQVPQTDPDLQILPVGEHEAIVRFSRGAGLPTKLPDVLGIAIKLPGLGAQGEDQDFLLVSSGQLPVLRRLLLPATGFERQRFSSVLAYRYRGGLPLLVGGMVESEDFPRARLDDPEAAPLRPNVTVQLEVATMLGAWARVAGVEALDRLPQPEAEALRFDPWDTSEELRPTGALNAIRGPAYRASQLARSLFGRDRSRPDRSEAKIERIDLG